MGGLGSRRFDLFGVEPVREWLKDLNVEDRKILGDDLRTLEYGWPMGMPLCRSIASHKGLSEVRSSLPHRRAKKSRIFQPMLARRLGAQV